MATVISDPLVGTIVDGRYEVVSRIARGGMATVYLATDRRLGRSVALKVMHAHLADGVEGAEFVSRFRREARAAARLTHPGLVAVYDQGFDGEISYLTMEYVDGTNLRRRLRAEGTLTLGETLRILEEILDGLSVAHRAGLVHRDIKPENVLLTKDGKVKLADFGLARAVTEVTATATGTVLGTVAYLSPELISSGQCDARSDVYSIGILAYEMLLGVHPHVGDTPIRVAYQHVNVDVPPPSRSAWWLPVEIDELVCALTARDVADRPNDAAAALGLVRQTLRALSDADLAGRVELPGRGSASGGSADTSAGPTTAFRAIRGEGSGEAVRGAETGGTDADSADADSADVPDEYESEPLDAIPTAVFEQLGRGGPPSSPTRAHPSFPPSGAIPLVMPQDPSRTARRSRHKRWWIWAASILAGLVIVLGGWTWWTTWGPGAFRTVPLNIVGAPLNQARDALDSVGLASHEGAAFDDSVPKGDIVTVDPAEGSSVDKDSTVELTVSKGIEKATVPEGLVGESGDAALGALRKAGFTDVPTPTQDYSDTVPQGSVISVSVKPGSTVPHNTPVDVTVSSGPAPVVVPQVTGTDSDSASKTLKGFGLTPKITKVYSTRVDSGNVIRQSPKQSSAAHRGDTVHLVVSKGPKMITVPNVVGKKAEAATKKLKAAGFKVKAQKFAGGFFDSVRFQSPSSGTKAAEGSTVTLTVF